jgi:hypothetical protein
VLAAGALAGAFLLGVPIAGGHAQGINSATSIAANDAVAASITGGIGDLDSSILSPDLDGDPRRLPRFRTPPSTEDGGGLRFGQLPSYGYRPGLATGVTGFDSTNARKRKPAGQPGQPAKPGSPAPSGVAGTKPQTTGSSNPTAAPASNAVPGSADAPAADPSATPNPQPTPRQLQPPAGPLPGRILLQNRPGAPPLTPDGEIATLATTLPYHRQLLEERPFDPLGILYGGFIFKPAAEYTRGYDNNAPRNSTPPTASSWYNVYASELLMNSNWDRHEFTAALRGSFTTYDTLHMLDRPNLDARVTSRIDVTRDTHLLLEGRYLLFTDYPGSPNIQVGVSHLPIAMTYGATAGILQQFNRVDVTLKGTFDRTVYNDSEFVDGETASNSGRNYNKYGSSLRAAYDVMPGIKPFVEAGAENRRYDLQFDAGGNDRTSQGYYAKAGTTLDYARKLVGEVSIGYLMRAYNDPTLSNIHGWTVDSALTWFATPLTTVKLINTTTVTEIVLTGVSGMFTRETTLQVEHAFRRWLVFTGKFTRAIDDYVGSTREDLRYVASTALSYYVAREIVLKGEYRNEWRHSNVPGNDYFAHVWLVGVRLQR